MSEDLSVTYSETTRWTATRKSRIHYQHNSRHAYVCFSRGAPVLRVLDIVRGKVDMTIFI